ncbi:hypothetical protein NLX86_06620 [Streptomyces sp. A3M-1-3]|uniref:hypothetical protein n=1 Tax=Streptomyces sp. A3M-1-3 TaxID=2962044 RepID=UPI0020B7DD87|nr:hypothetical protein [Streptomyces sp. A3M-1-3]MCP3817820.1 hypothetical protein [Streptomyces sp. A3M-1-3]
MRLVRAAASHLARGTGVLGRQFGAWLLPGSVRGAAKRLAAVLALGWLLGGIALAAPALMWLLAAGWCAAAYRVSVSSATPPPEAPAPSRREEAGQSAAPAIVVEDREGMLIYRVPSEARRYKVREETNQP